MKETDQVTAEKQELIAQVDSSNLHLARVLDHLQTDNSSEAAYRLAEEANRILYGAIFQYPQIAHSVAVDIKPDAHLHQDQTYDRLYEAYRAFYTSLVESLTSQNIANPSSLAVPLPFIFKGGIAAEDNSRREVFFGTVKTKMGLDQQIALRVLIKLPIGPAYETAFLPNEISNIKLSPKTQFTPYLRDWGITAKRQDYVDHYLLFRGFTHKPHIRQNLLIPFGIRELWHWENGKLDGFFVMSDNDPEKTILYEVKNKPIYSLYDTGSITRLVAETISRTNPNRKRRVFNCFNSNCDIYSGNQILERLAQIPAGERLFF